MQERERTSALRQAGARSKLEASFRSSSRPMVPAVTEPRPASKPAPVLGQMTVLGSFRRPAIFHPPMPLPKTVPVSTPAGINASTPTEPAAPVIAAPVNAAPAAAVPTPLAAPPPITATPAAAAAAAAAAPKARPAAPSAVVQLLKAQAAQSIEAREAADAQRQARARRALVAASRPRARELTGQLTPPRHPHDAPIYMPVGVAYMIPKAVPAAIAAAAAITPVPVRTVPALPAAPPMSPPSPAAAVDDDDTAGWDNSEPPPLPLAPSRVPQPAPRPAALPLLRLLRPEPPKAPARRSSSEGHDSVRLDDGSPGGGGAASSAPPSTASAPGTASDEAPSEDAGAVDTPTADLPPFSAVNFASSGEPLAPAVITVEPPRIEPSVPSAGLLGGASGAAPEAPRRRRRRGNPFSPIGRAARSFWRTKIAACFCGAQVSPDG